MARESSAPGICPGLPPWQALPSWPCPERAPLCHGPCLAQFSGRLDGGTITIHMVYLPMPSEPIRWVQSMRVDPTCSLHEQMCLCSGGQGFHSPGRVVTTAEQWVGSMDDGEQLRTSCQRVQGLGIRWLSCAGGQECMTADEEWAGDSQPLGMRQGRRDWS